MLAGMVTVFFDEWSASRGPRLGYRQDALCCRRSGKLCSDAIDRFIGRLRAFRWRCLGPRTGSEGSACGFNGGVDIVFAAGGYRTPCGAGCWVGSVGCSPPVGLELAFWTNNRLVVAAEITGRLMQRSALRQCQQASDSFTPVASPPCHVVSAVVFDKGMLMAGFL